MGKATGFQLDSETGDIRMNRGDTGAFWVHAARSSGENWTADSRMLFTIRNDQGDVVLQRIYRLDDQYDKGDGYVLIEFHNDDTDKWATGQYQMERRYNVSPIWEGTPSTARCVNALTSDAHMVEGVAVRTAFQGMLTIEDIYGEV